MSSFLHILRIVGSKKSSRAGFTLVELLIVMSVAAVLFTAAISLVDPTFQIGRGNDAKRKADLLSIQSGFERYYADNGDYPGPVGWSGQISSASDPQIKDALSEYLNTVPQDPKFADTAQDYYYWHYEAGQYRLYAVLENVDDDQVQVQILTNDCSSCTGTSLAYNYRSGSEAPLGPTSTPTLTPSATPTPAVLVNNTSNSGSTQTSSSVSWTHTVGGTNRLLVVGAATKEDETLTVKWKGTETFTRKWDDGDDNDQWAYWYYLVNPSVGTGQISVTFGSSQNIKAGAISLTGVNQSSPLGNHSVKHGSGSTVTTSSIPSSPTGMIVDVIAIKGYDGFSTPVSGQNEIWDTRSNSGIQPSGAGSYKIGSASTTMGWGGWGGSKDVTIIAVPINPAQ